MSHSQAYSVCGRGATIVYIGSAMLLAMLLATLWVFPTPFSYVFGTQTWLLCFIASIVVVFQYLSEKRERRSQILVFARKTTIEATFLLIYPLYNALFLQLTKGSQLVFVLVQPVVKFALKRVIARAVVDVKEGARVCGHGQRCTSPSTCRAPGRSGPHSTSSPSMRCRTRTRCEASCVRSHRSRASQCTALWRPAASSRTQCS